MRLKIAVSAVQFRPWPPNLSPARPARGPWLALPGCRTSCNRMPNSSMLMRTPVSARGLGITRIDVARILPWALIAALAACSKAPPPAGDGTTPAPAAAAAPDAEAPPVKPVPEQLPEVVARVNGQSITRTDFEKAIRAIESREGAPVPTTQRDRV